MVHLWAVIVSLMPHFISRIPNATPRSSTLVWISLSVVTLSFFYMIPGTPYQGSQHNEWLPLKAVMIAAASIGLSLMSIINFATAQFGSIFLVPYFVLIFLDCPVSGIMPNPRNNVTQPRKDVPPGRLYGSAVYSTGSHLFSPQTLSQNRRLPPGPMGGRSNQLAGLV